MFWVTALREAKRPQRKLFEPEGRVFAPAVQRALERSKTVYSQEESWSTGFEQEPVHIHLVLESPLLYIGPRADWIHDARAIPEEAASGAAAGGNRT